MSHQPAQPVSTGLAPNLAGALAYVLGPLTGVLFLVIEKENRFVRYHAAQSVVVGIALVAVSIGLSIVGAILAVVPFIGWLISLMLTMTLALGGFLLWVTLMLRAFAGQEWEVPLIGHHSRKLIGDSPAQ
jgi:uncharacterized membrane protein